MDTFFVHPNLVLNKKASFITSLVLMCILIIHDAFLPLYLILLAAEHVWLVTPRKISK